MFARSPLCLGALLGALLLVGRSLAAESEPREQPDREPPSEKRDVPDYDGRPPPPPTTEEVLLWGPRIILFPAYLVSEYLIRQPLGFLIAGAERSGIPVALYDFLTFGPDHRAGVFPTAFLDFGFSPSAGLYIFYNDAFMRGHDLRLRGATWGLDWLSASFSERFKLDEEGSDRIVLEASGLRRPDYAFYGIGPDTRESARVRYGRDTLETRAFAEKRLWRASSLHARLALRAVGFSRGGFGDDDPTLDQAIDGQALPEPPGYRGGYTLFESSITAALDSREPRPAPGSGVRVHVDGAHAADVRNTESFVSYGVTAAGYLDLNDRQRVLSLSVATKFVDPIGEAEVPFTELASLGGSQPMRGLYPERLLDRSAAVAGLSYRWPIWIWLDGAMNLEVGNVFGAQLEGFEVDRLRLSGSIGVESSGSRDQALQVLVGFGSETFESGGKIDSFRLAFGTTHGF